MGSNFSKLTATTLLLNTTLQTQLQPQQLSAAEALQFNRHQINLNVQFLASEPRQVLGAINGEEFATIDPEKSKTMTYEQLEELVTASKFGSLNPPTDSYFTFFLDGVQIEPKSRSDPIPSEGKLTAVLGERNRLLDWFNDDSQRSLISDVDMEVWARKNLGLGGELTFARPKSVLSRSTYDGHKMFHDDAQEIADPTYKSVIVGLMVTSTEQVYRRAFDEFEKLLEHASPFTVDHSNFEFINAGPFERLSEVQSDLKEYEKQRDAFFEKYRNTDIKYNVVFINARYVDNGTERKKSIFLDGSWLNFEIRKTI